MPRITKVTSQSETEHKVSVKPDGDTEAGGKLLAGSKDGSDLKEVGTWKAKALSDGEGVAKTERGVFLFAEQDGKRSEPVVLPRVVPGP
jgi:hypothetical protein